VPLLRLREWAQATEDLEVQGLGRLLLRVSEVCGGGFRLQVDPDSMCRSCILRVERARGGLGG